MALGGAFLPLLLWLWLVQLAEDLSLGDAEDTKISAPVDLEALIPPAAEATVAAGEVPEEHIQGTAPVHCTTTGSVVTPPPGKPSILIVGDTRYQWQEWSHWYCNCEQGSMSRVRDITYSTPGVVLDPAQYDVLRFQRVVCSYDVCPCDREAQECDKLQVTCDAEEPHICALRDIELAQKKERKDFWVHLHEELRNLKKSIQEAFPQRRKETKEKSAR